MPRGDGTGPAGLGPMTGRAAGYCAGYNTPGYMNPYGGRGYFAWGRGWFGRGRGWRNWARITGLPGWQRAQMGWPAWGNWGYTYPADPAQEKEMLTQELEALKQEMKAVEERLAEIKISKSKK